MSHTLTQHLAVADLAAAMRMSTVGLTQALKDGTMPHTSAYSFQVGRAANGEWRVTITADDGKPIIFPSANELLDEFTATPNDVQHVAHSASR